MKVPSGTQTVDETEVLSPAFAAMRDCTTVESVADWLMANPQVLLANINMLDFPDFVLRSVIFSEMARSDASFVGWIEIEYLGRILRPYRLLAGSGLDAGFLAGFSSCVIEGKGGNATVYRAKYSVTLRGDVWQKMSVFHRLANAEQYAD
jgi:hypothetical protein